MLTIRTTNITSKSVFSEIVFQFVRSNRNATSKRTTMSRTTLAHRMLCFALSLIFMGAFPTSTFAWSSKAHHIIAALAWLKLKEDTRTKINDLLGVKAADPNGPLVAISMWADEQRISDLETASWHFVDIPLSAAKYDEQRDCPNKNCLVVKINEKKLELSNSRSRQVRIDALKYLVNLVGDLHQPLHCADNNDAAGNRVPVKFFGNLTTLHKVWDEDMIQRTGLTEDQYINKLKGIRTSQGFWIEDWANDSHALAVKYAYAIPQGGDLGNAYYKTNLPILERQLAIAAEKLAQILDGAFSSSPANNAPRARKLK